jgi:acyl-CoA reductase-like NAD-dependent aldehyde dehydrogenase
MSDFEYANAPESPAIANIASNYGLFIGGKFVQPKKGKNFNTINPATEEVLSKIGYADKSDIDAAVKSARSAYLKVWSKMPAKERGKYLFR